MKLGIIVPSNNPEAFLNNFASSYRHAYDPLHKKHMVFVLLTAQPPWSLSEIELVDRAVPNLRWCYAANESPPRMCMLRQSSAALLPDADVYMLADDNMRFLPAGQTDPECPHGKGSGEKYAEVLNYLGLFRTCGVVQCHTSDPRGLGETIAPTYEGLITTAKGLFIRNVFKGQMWPRETMRYLASMEETIPAYRVIEKGYYPAKQYQNPTQHTIHRIGSDVLLHSRSLINQYCARWVRETYGDPNWQHEANVFPLLLMERAARNGGARIVSFDPAHPDFRFDYGTVTI